jgi:hypothetical protein
VSAPALLFAAAALLPAMTAPQGPAQMTEVAALAVDLCNGGSLLIPLGTGAPLPATPCCCAKGCRGGKRKRIDRKQCR